jgi:hypothetical protein
MTTRKKDGTEITEEDVGEEYSPNPKLLREGDDTYLLTKRIELDAIVEKAGAHALWHFIIYKLEETFPDARDYSPVISEPKPENFYTQEMNEFIEYLNNFTRGSYDEEWTKIKRNAEEVNGLIEVDREDEANDIILKSVVQQDEGIKTISTKLKELMESRTLPKIKQIQPKPDREKLAKQKPEPIEIPEEPRLKEDVKIHVDPEYDIFGVFKDKNNSAQNQHAVSQNKIDVKCEGGSNHSDKDNEPTLNGSDLTIPIRAFNKKHPNLPKNDLKEMLNGISSIVKIYRISRANLEIAPKGSGAERELRKHFNEIQSNFKKMQQLLASINIHMDSDGKINAKWIWGKIEK